jgi:hypothetical protein
MTMRAYRVQYAGDFVTLSEAVTELNRQALQRKANEFRIVAVVKDDDKWVAMLEREIDSNVVDDGRGSTAAETAKPRT